MTRRRSVSTLNMRKGHDKTSLEPFLPWPTYPPKRNEARGKLHNLSSKSFRGLCSDLKFEFERRYPEVVLLRDKDLSASIYQTKEGEASVLSVAPSYSSGGSSISSSPPPYSYAVPIAQDRQMESASKDAAAPGATQLRN